MSGALPEGWATISVGNACRLVNGRAFKPSDWTEDGLRIIRIQNLNNAAAPFNHFAGTVDPKFLVREGELLFAWSGTPGTSFGAHIWASGSAILNQHIFRVLDYEQLFNKRFMRHAINVKLDDLIDVAHGTAGLAHVTKPVFEAAELALPPLPEQHRIVEKVEALLEQVNRAKGRLERVTLILKRFRQAVLAAACSGELTREWRDALGREAESDDNPSAWRRKRVEEIASPEPRSIQSGPFGSNLLHSEFQNHGRLVIGIDNVADGAFVPGRQHRISEAKFRELERYRARPLDVLITVMATVGRSCVVPENIEPAIITKHVYRISCDRTLMNPHFLLSVLRGSPELRGEMHDQVRGQTRPGINGEILKELVVPVPPLDEQAEIVRQVNRLFALADAIERRVRAATAGAEKLPQAILSKAFSGELVPTEAELARAEGRSYETAEELLARVRLEGAEAVSAPKRQRRLAGARGRR